MSEPRLRGYGYIDINSSVDYSGEFPVCNELAIRLSPAASCGPNYIRISDEDYADLKRVVAKIVDGYLHLEPLG